MTLSISAQEQTERLIFHDYVLFVIVFICPYLDGGVWSTVTHFMPFFNALGCQFLTFILSLYLFQYAVRHRYVATPRTLYIVVLFASLWSFIKLVSTITITGFVESTTIYRHNFILLPSFLFCMSYISNMSTRRMELLFKLAMKWILFTSVFYFLQCFGFSIFTSNIHTQTVAEFTVIRNILGLPPTTPVFLCLFFISYLFGRSSKMLIYTFLCMAFVILSYTRSLMAVMGVAVVFSVWFYAMKYGFNDRTNKVIFYISVAFGLALIIFPNTFSFWSALLDNTINSQLVKEQGTYDFRLRLIEKAMITNNMEGVVLTGAGYIRDSVKGTYSYILGGDTYVAPILRCEGFIGIILRCIPCVYLLWESIKMFFSRHSDETTAMLSLVIMVSILSEFPNYVQTTIFVRYNFIMSMLYMIYIYIQNRTFELDNNVTEQK